MVSSENNLSDSIGYKSVNSEDSPTLSVDASPYKASTAEKIAIGRRMSEARERLGLSRKAFASKFGGVTVRTLENNEAGRNEAGALVLSRFRSLGVNTNWLLTGEGEMLSAQVYAVNQPRAEYNVTRLQPQIDVTLLTAIIAAVDMANPSLSHTERASIAAKAYAESLAPKASL